VLRTLKIALENGLKLKSKLTDRLV